MNDLSKAALEQIAGYFQTLSDATRLQILNLLRQQERNVGELAEQCGCSSANISRHLAILGKLGMVKREARGTSVYYSISDPAVYHLCDIVCGSIERQFKREAEVFAPVRGEQP